MTDLLRRQPNLYIAGQWCEASDGAVEEVINPATEEPLASVPVGTIEDCDRAIGAARRAFDEGPWPHLSPRDRSEALRAFHGALAAREKEIVRLVVAEVGAPEALARHLHVRTSLHHLEWYADMAARELVTALPPTVTPLATGSSWLGASVAVR